MATSLAQLKRIAETKIGFINGALGTPKTYAETKPVFRANVGHYMVEHSGSGNRYRLVQVTSESACTRDLSDTLPLAQLVDVIDAFLLGAEAMRDRK